MHPAAYVDPSPFLTVGGGLLTGALALLTGACGIVLAGFGRFHGWLRPWRRGVIILLVAAAAAGTVVWRLMSAATNSGAAGRGRVVLLGLDGLSPDILEPMMAAGNLPNFARLRDLGGYRRLQTTTPPQSPVAWCSFATGRRPGRHGVFDFIRRDPRTYLPEIGIVERRGTRVRSRRRGKAFWDYCTQLGVPCTILRCPVTFPPDPITGRMLSGMGVPDLLGTQGTFSFYTGAEIADTAEVHGQIFHIADGRDGRVITIRLPGPNRRSLTGAVEPVAVEIRLTRRADALHVQLPDAAFDMPVGTWSPWQTVTFKLGPMRRLRGIVQFFLVSLEPHVQLYAGPVSIDPRRPFLPISYPPDYSARLARELGLYATRGMPFDTWALNQGRIGDAAFRAQADTLLTETTRRLYHELARTGDGVFFAYVEYPDIMQHMYWRCRDAGHPAAPPDVAAADRQRIANTYRTMDGIVGDVMRRLAAGDVFIVFSDHGFTAFRRAVHLNSWLRDHGYLVLTDGANEGAELFGNVDWSRTSAYAVGFGGIYINRRGREAQGIVAADAIPALKAEIAQRLLAWRDGDGPPIVHAVHDGAAVFAGPAVDEAPDLYVGFRRGYRASWQTAMGAAPRPTLEDNRKTWSGTHLVDAELVPGVLFCNRALGAAKPHIMDLAPTILRLVGLSDAALAAADLDGKPLLP